MYFVIIPSYTSGQVNVWRIGDHSEPSTVKYLSMQEISVPTCCAMSGGWGAVGTKDGESIISVVKSMVYYSSSSLVWLISILL